jgi:2,5-diketo-D-gluconate reductase A
MTNATAKTVTLRNGSAMPLLGFGTWQLRGQETYDSVRAALEVGYRHIDTATGYGNEQEVGRAIKDSGLPRDEVWVTTKCPPDHLGREQATIDASLADLGLDHVDLWLVHWPPNKQATPEMWAEFINARDAGKTSAIGVSNYSPAQISELILATGEAPAVNQIPWSPALHDPALWAQFQEREVVLEGYSPFRRSQLDDPVFVEIAAAHGVTPAQTILRWHLQLGIVVIPKAAHLDRVRENFDLDGFELADDEIDRISALGTRLASVDSDPESAERTLTFVVAGGPQVVRRVSGPDWSHVLFSLTERQEGDLGREATVAQVFAETLAPRADVADREITADELEAAVARAKAMRQTTGDT